MLTFVIGVVGGVVLCLAAAWGLGRLHTGRTTGPNSRMPVTETAIPVVKKG